MPPIGPNYRQLQISGLLVIVGLLVEGVCLLWSRPIAFVVLAALGGLLIAVGVLFFLYSLVFAPRLGSESGTGARKED